MQALDDRLATTLTGALLVAALLGAPTAAAVDLQIEFIGAAFQDTTPAIPVTGNPGTTLGEQRRLAITAAADTWADRLEGTVPVHVRAHMSELGCAPGSVVLGRGGTFTLHADFVGALLPSTHYAAALANQLAGTDLNGSEPELEIILNSSLGPDCGFDWYTGTGAAPDGLVSMQDVVRHEIAHGVGFQTFTHYVVGERYLGLDDAFMWFLRYSGQLLTMRQMTAEQLAASSNRSAVWDGRVVNAESTAFAPISLIERRVPMDNGPLAYPDSLFNHFSVRISPDELMEPQLPAAIESERLAMAVLADIGWTVSGLDVDRDGVLDIDDNCLDTANPAQQDLDGDGIGNACDPDADADGMDDAWERGFGLDPLDPSDADADADEDGFTNRNEFRHGSNPIDATIVPPRFPLDPDDVLLLLDGAVHEVTPIGESVYVEPVPVEGDELAHWIAATTHGELIVLALPAGRPVGGRSGLGVLLVFDSRFNRWRRIPFRAHLTSSRQRPLVHRRHVHALGVRIDLDTGTTVPMWLHRDGSPVSSGAPFLRIRPDGETVSVDPSTWATDADALVPLLPVPIRDIDSTTTLDFDVLPDGGVARLVEDGESQYVLRRHDPANLVQDYQVLGAASAVGTMLDMVARPRGDVVLLSTQRSQTAGHDGYLSFSSPDLHTYSFVRVSQGTSANATLRIRIAAIPPRTVSGARVPDPALAACLEQTLPFDAPIESVQHLSCAGRGIRSVIGLQSFTGLISADFRDNPIADLRPLEWIPGVDVLADRVPLASLAFADPAMARCVADDRTGIPGDTQYLGWVASLGSDMDLEAELDLAYSGLLSVWRRIRGPEGRVHFTRFDFGWLDLAGRVRVPPTQDLPGITFAFGPDGRVVATVDGVGPTDVPAVTRGVPTGTRSARFVDQVSQLDCRGYPIRDLDGISALTRLGAIVLDHTNVDSVAPLLDLPGLGFVSFRHAPVGDADSLDAHPAGPIRVQTPEAPVFLDRVLDVPLDATVARVRMRGSRSSFDPGNSSRITVQTAEHTVGPFTARDGIHFAGGDRRDFVPTERTDTWIVEYPILDRAAIECDRAFTVSTAASETRTIVRILGTSGNCEADSDGDGVPDREDAFPLDPTETADHDGDGIGDHTDPDDDNDGIPDEEERSLGLDPLDGSDCPDWICGRPAWMEILRVRGACHE